MKDKGEIVLFQSEDGSVKLDVRLESETVWLTQQQIASLYGKAVSTVNEHIKDIFEDKELTPEACTKKFGNSEFQQKAPYYYNLKMILAVNGRPILEGAGGISNKDAREKAIAEYRKYQVRELTPVERAYLESLQKETAQIQPKTKP